MTIKYLDSKRISALSSDFPTTTTSYNHIADTGDDFLNLHDTNRYAVMKILSGSPAIGTSVQKIKISMRKVGTPAGTFKVGIWNASDVLVISVTNTASSFLTTSYVDYEFDMGSATELLLDYKVGIEYLTGVGVSNRIDVEIIYATTETGYSKGYPALNTGGVDLDILMSFDSTPVTISKPTNVQDNSILVEKDTGRRYWFDAEISNLALTDPTPASSDYTNSGSSFTFASNKIHADAVGYGSTLTMCTRPLTTTFIPTTNGCMIDFKFDWTTAGGSGNDTGVAIGLFDTRAQADGTNNGINIEFVTSPSYARNVQFKCEGVFDNSSVQGYPVPDEYYCRIIVQKDGSATGKGYTSEADRTADTNAVFSRSTAAQTGFSEKTIFGILNTRPTGGGNVVGDLDSINVYSGITATTPATWTREIPSFTGSYFMSGGTAAPWTPVNYHDQFNGTTWATASNLPTAVSLNAGTGTKEDGASFGGDTSGTATPVNNNQSWTGSSWSASQAMNTTRNQTTGGGATGSTSGWVAGGRVTSSGNPVNTSEQWNGTSWSTGGNMSGVRRNSGGAGIVTEAWNAGGYTGSAKLDTMELYNGTAWSAGSNIHSPTDGLAQGGGDSYNCFYVGGAEASATIDHTHIYNGTAWSLGNTLTFTVKYNATMGTPQDAITACGYQATGGGWAGVLAATYNGTVWTSSTNVTRGRGTGAGGT